VFSGILKPAGAYVHLSIEVRNIRLDVKQRGAIEHVDIPDVKHALFDPIQLDYGQADWVWTLGRTGGKKPTCHRIQVGYNVQAKSPASVEIVQQHDVRESVQILEAGLVFLENLDRACCTGRTGGLDWHAL